MPIQEPSLEDLQRYRGLFCVCRCWDCGGADLHAGLSGVFALCAAQPAAATGSCFECVTARIHVIYEYDLQLLARNVEVYMRHNNSILGLHFNLAMLLSCSKLASGHGLAAQAGTTGVNFLLKGHQTKSSTCRVYQAQYQLIAG